MEVGNRFILSVYLILAVALVAGIGILLDIEKARRQVRTIDRVGTTTGTEWNDFSSSPLKPTLNEAKGECIAVVPTKERTAALRHITRILPHSLRSPDYAFHLLPLRGWRGENVFLVRRKVDTHWIQLTDGGGKAALEVCAVDGIPMLPPNASANAIRQLAQKWLPEYLQPATFRLTKDANRIATWTTADEIDGTGVQLGVCNCYSDGRLVKFEFAELMPKCKSAYFPPYTFGQPAGSKAKMDGNH